MVLFFCFFINLYSECYLINYVNFYFHYRSVSLYSVSFVLLDPERLNVSFSVLKISGMICSYGFDHLLVMLFLPSVKVKVRLKTH